MKETINCVSICERLFQELNRSRSRKPLQRQLIVYRKCNLVMTAKRSLSSFNPQVKRENELSSKI